MSATIVPAALSDFVASGFPRLRLGKAVAVPVPLLDVPGSAQVPAPDGGRLSPGLELLPALFVGGGQLLPLLREGPAATDSTSSNPGIERVVGRLARL